MAPYATDAEARAYYAGTADATKVGVVLRQAARLVQRHAPAPDPLPSPDDYSPAAKDAELMVGAWLWETGGFKTSTSKGIDVIRRGESYADLSAVKRIVAQTMGPYSSSGKVTIRNARRG